MNRKSMYLFKKATEVLKYDGVEKANAYLLERVERLTDSNFVLVNGEPVNRKTFTVHVNWFLPRILRENLIRELRLNR